MNEWLRVSLSRADLAPLAVICKERVQNYVRGSDENAPRKTDEAITS